MGRTGVAMIAGAVAAIACRAGTSFSCVDDSACFQAGTAGVCQPTGYCSFPDAGCPSGLRYDGLAPQNLAGVCVPLDDDTTSTSTTATTTDTTSAGPGPATSGTGTAGTAGSTGPLPDGIIDVGGELIEVPDGWTGGVWIDFSDQYTFDANAYPDPPFVYTNAPQHLFILDAPFNPGLAAITVHTVIELHGPDSVTERNYFQVTPTGPDALWTAARCDGWNGIDVGYCVSAGSQGGGDGIFVIGPDWTMDLVATINNSNFIGFDAAGAFDGLGTPQLYYATPTGLFRYLDVAIIPDRIQAPLVVAGSRLAAVRPEEPDFTLQLIASGTHALTELALEPGLPNPIAIQNHGAISIVRGEPSVLPGLVYTLMGATELVEFADDGTLTSLARSADGQNWQWAAAVVPGAMHPLSGSGTRFYILEADRPGDLDRVIWLQPPG